MKHINAIKRMVRSDCACFYAEDGYCCSRDDACVYFMQEDKPRCGYFEQSILPMDEKLSQAYAEEHALQYDATTKLKQGCKCQRCMQEFTAMSNRQMYCPDCITKNRREKDRERQRKNRVSVTL